MNKIAFSSIRLNLTFWLLFLALIPFTIGMIIAYQASSKALEKDNINKLTAIRDLKVDQIERWINERSGDLRTFAQNTDASVLIDALNSPDNNSYTQKQIRDILHNYQKAFPLYDEIFIINSKTGIVDISTNRIREGRDKKDEAYFFDAIKANKIVISPVFYSAESGKNLLTFSAPVYDEWNENGKTIGVLVANIDLSNSLYPLLNNRIGLGKTGETLIVNKNAVAINELIYQQNATLQFQIAAEPAIFASQGKTGIVKSNDYRGSPVLAAYTYIPKTEWGVVCKQDLAELEAPTNEMGRKLFMLFILSGLIIIVIVYFVSKSISKPVVSMYRVAQKIGAGDFSARNIVKSNNELGSLAREFNTMADTTESKIKIQQGVVDISETMIGRLNMQQFGSSLLKRLMKITEANMSTFYILNNETLEYDHFVSVGANKEMLSSFSAENPPGEFGNTLSTKKIFYLRNIPESTIFKFKTIAGEAIPKEIITIPIMVENAIVAIISLVNIQTFSHEAYEILNLSWTNINTSYSNLIVSERTRVLAEYLSETNQKLEAQSEELQDQAEELQDQASELQYNSNELQEQNIELEIQRKQVETANKLKSEFLSNMSHELRTPLNSIMALSRVLITQANDKLNEEENNYLQIVERNGKRLLSLINDILDLSKIEAGKMEINPKFISIKSLLQISKENLQNLAEEKGLTFILDIPQSLPQIETDESKLHQVLTNIIGNSVKFTEKGSIHISANYDSENVFIKISDSGIGIAEKDLPYIFDEFRQVDGTSSRQYEGTGLGLAIAKKIIQILGAKIEVESKLGIGSAFTISIPIKWHEKILTDDSFHFENLPSQSTENTILIVDDDPKTIKIISEYLIEAGYKTITATSGAQALKLAGEYLPFAITLDIVMEDMDGWEVLQKLKHQFKTKDIPVIVVSVSDERDTGLALGAVGFIHKPVNKNVLISQIREINQKPGSVMIVDDNEFELKQISKIIETEKIETILALSGKECIRLLENKIPDLLVLDLMMPEMDGFSVLEKLRKDKKTQNLPVIIVTAKDLTKDEKNKLRGNVQSLVAKSETSPVFLLNEIKRILKELEKTRGMDVTTKKNSKTRILIVEDNPDAIIQVKSVLEKENYAVDVANGGKDALDYLQNNIPDGIILDLMMPEIDGFEVLEKIRIAESTKNIPVLILTAKDLNKNDLAKLKTNNIQQLVLKGDVDINGLLKNINLMLGNEPKEIIQNSEVTVSGSKIQVQNPNPKSLNGLPNILIVEDNDDNRTTLKAILKDKYSIAEAIDGEQGFALAQTQIPDIILLDMSLPGLSGEKLIRHFKFNEKTKNIPLIAVTAQAMMGDKERFLALGCDGYVSKPIDQNVLLTEMNRLLNSH